MLLPVAARVDDLLDGRYPVARVGGDELAVLVTHLADVDTADQVAARLCEGMTPPLALSARELFVPASVAMAYAAHDRSTDGEQVLRTACQ